MMTAEYAYVCVCVGGCSLNEVTFIGSEYISEYFVFNLSFPT